MEAVAVRLAPHFDPAAYPQETVRCNLCGWDGAVKIVARQDRYGLPVQTVECKCGLRFINPRMTPSAYAEFYAKHYRQLLSQMQVAPYTPAKVRQNQREYLAQGFIPKVAAIVEPYPGSHIVDVGGSTGLVGQAYAKTCDGVLTVIDTCAAELAEAEKAGHRTICATAETAELEPGTADVVLLCRTIEHLCDPMGVLMRIRPWLSARGYLVVDAMDVDNWPKSSRYKIDHPYAFTAQTLERLVTAAGWRVRGRWTRLNRMYTGLVCSPEES